MFAASRCWIALCAGRKLPQKTGVRSPSSGGHCSHQAPALLAGALIGWPGLWFQPSGSVRFPLLLPEPGPFAASRHRLEAYFMMPVACCSRCFFNALGLVAQTPA